MIKLTFTDGTEKEFSSANVLDNEFNEEASFVKLIKRSYDGEDYDEDEDEIITTIQKNEIRMIEYE